LPLHFLNVGAFQEPIILVSRNKLLFSYLFHRLPKEMSYKIAYMTFPDLTSFSLSAASPDNPAVYGDPGEPSLHC
jgi:hypothetical protein